MQSILEGFNLKKQANELGVSIWRSPGFLFILMGIIIISSMLAVYFVFNNPDSVEYLLLSEFTLVLVLFTVGNSIISGVDEIARANKMKTEFVSIASHQLKTPLSEINWEMELLVSKFSEGLNEKQRELIANVNNSNARMIRLVNDLLDVARIDQGRLPLVREELDIIDIIEDVIDNNKNLAKSHNVEVNIRNYGSVPKLVGDRKRIVVVLDNLLSNSIKYTKEKGSVDVAITPEKDRIVVCVKDEGVGIPKKQQKNVFHKFFRSDNAIKNQTEGTGLGLYIAKNVIVQSGGEMWFDSEENKGSTFCFSLPLKKNDKFYSVSM